MPGSQNKDRRERDPPDKGYKPHGCLHRETTRHNNVRKASAKILLSEAKKQEDSKRKGNSVHRIMSKNSIKSV